MGICSWIALGLIAGGLAKLIMPGKDPGGIFVTTFIGIGGAILGGFIATQFGLGDISGLNPWSMLVSIGGAVLLLLGYRLIKGKNAPPPA